jgi:serine/threonine protein kinase
VVLKFAKLTHPDAISSSFPSPSSIGAMTAQTKSGVILGTMAYMSPETATGRPVDARRHIFSLGTILYEKLTGNRAFHGETDIGTMAAVLRESAGGGARSGRHTPQLLNRSSIISLEKEAEKRLQSARDPVFGPGKLVRRG